VGSKVPRAAGDGARELAGPENVGIGSWSTLPRPPPHPARQPTAIEAAATIAMRCALSGTGRR
jgi:hypothetical protein